MNLCTSCNQDFSSVAAFDRHRIGVHEYLYPEGLDMTPSREDGRRCMEESEMLEAGMESDASARWRIVLSESERERLVSLREAA